MVLLGVGSVFFCFYWRLSGLRSDLGLASLTYYFRWKCDQKWIYELIFISLCLLTTLSYNIGQKIWQIGLEGW